MFLRLVFPFLVFLAFLVGCVFLVVFWCFGSFVCAFILSVYLVWLVGCVCVWCSLFILFDYVPPPPPPLFYWHPSPLSASVIAPQPKISKKRKKLIKVLTKREKLCIVCSEEEKIDGKKRERVFCVV